MMLFYFITFLSVSSFVLGANKRQQPSARDDNPQVVFMETMRRKLDLSLKEGTLDDVLPTADIGHKIAATVTPTNTTGTYANEFIVAKNQKLEMIFDFSFIKTAEAKQVTIASIFLPQVVTTHQTTANRYFELGLLMTVSPLFKNDGTKRKRSTIVWDSNTSCMRIDVTTPIHKLLKQLCSKVEPSNRLGKLTIEIKSIQTTTLPTSPSAKFSQESSMCMELAKTNATSQQQPFLVLDYTREEVVSGGSPAPLVRDAELSSVELRQMYNRRPTRSTSGNTMMSSNNDSCAIKDLHVDLSEILLPTIVSPSEPINIKDCSGKCYNGNLVVHSVLKKYHLLNQTISDNEPQDEEITNSCCTPAKLTSTVVLIRHFNGVYELLTIPNSIVESCWCIYK